MSRSLSLAIQEVEAISDSPDSQAKAEHSLTTHNEKAQRRQRGRNESNQMEFDDDINQAF